MKKNMPIISQTKLNMLQERVCRPINYLTTRITSDTPLWDGPVSMCQQIENDDYFAVDSVALEAKKSNGLFSGTNIRYYHAILCRVYIILYYRHRDDKLYQEIVFPRLKVNMGIYSKDHLKFINEQIDNILKQEELMKNIQDEKKKDVKPVFAYISHNGNEQDNLFIEYSEEQLFRNISNVIKELSKRYETNLDEANVWYNAKEVVRTLRNVSRPELLIDRAAVALAGGQMFNGYKGAQIILVCAYAMILVSKDNSHFLPFIQKMDSLSGDTSTDLEVISYSIKAVKNWITENMPFDGYDYIDEETIDTENYTVADIKRISKEYEEQLSILKSENGNLKKENIQLKEQFELLKQQTEEDASFEELNWHDKVRLNLLLRLMKNSGANLEKYGNKTKAANIMKTVTSIPLQTCKNFCSEPILSIKEHEDEILRLNSILQALEMNILL